MTNDDYKELIIELLEDMGESDRRFLIQLYTIINLHIEKKGRR